MVEREEMENLLLRYCEGETTPEETILVEEWMEASAENGRMARRIQTIGLAADLAQVSPRVDVKRALASTHRRMKQGKADRYRVLFRGMQRAAAILFIPLVISWCILYFNGAGDVAQMIEVRTNPGMTTSVDLPDGTKVILNSSSSLRYPSHFSDKSREVELVGEAFFSVAKDGKQFVVDALNHSKIVVYGTEFNIEAYPESGTVQTTLVSGKVSFSYFNDRGNREHLMMNPGQKAIYDIEQERVLVKSANVDVETCWKDGRLVFKNTPFEEVLKNLSKRYNVEFVLKNPDLKQNSFTATFAKQRLERILENFRISSNIQFKFVEDNDINAERQVIEVY